MNFKVNESSAKLRGGYYTPAPVASFLTRWVLASQPKSILEPSCGDGAFIRTFKGLHRQQISLTGIEIVSEEVVKAKDAISQNSYLSAKIIEGNFLEWAIQGIDQRITFDAVLGNPPYIRYQYLEKKDQELAERLFVQFGLPFTKHTNSWVPFVIASQALLRPGGRMALVIPSEILHVLHAGPLRRLLIEQFRRVLLIDPTELLFDEALQGTVLLLAEKREAQDKSCDIAIVHAPNNTFLDHEPDELFRSASYVSGEELPGKWMKLLLDKDELNFLQEIEDNPQINRFSNVAKVDVGIVTGANKFFLIDDKTVRAYDLAKWVKPMFGRSEHCAGVIYDAVQHEANKKEGLPTNFVMLGNTPIDSLPAAVRNYIKIGEGQDLHSRYKCRIRTPWYDVPSVYSTRIGMLKRCHNFPRLILNSFGALTTDTAYRIQPSKSINPNRFVYSFVNSLTALSAELEGRHYGGGVLELVPSEIEKLLIPLARQADVNLAQLNKIIKSGEPAENILRVQDKTVLKAIGLNRRVQEAVQNAWHRLRSRRHRSVLGPLDMQGSVIG